MTTTRKPRQFFAVWNDEGTAVKGATFEESIFVDGQFWKNEQTPIAPDSFGAFGDLFSNQLQTQYSSLVAQNAALLEAKAKLESQLESFQADKQLEIDCLNSTHKEQVDSLQSQIAEVTKQKEDNADLVAAANARVAAANVRIARLLEGMPWNPRVIDATAFFNRLTLEEFARLSTSDDPVKVDIAKTIMQYKAPENDWPVIFESDQFQQMMGYLLQSGEITEQRMAELTRDSTREESYVADE
jgi:hypothetical protein